MSRLVVEVGRKISPQEFDGFMVNCNTVPMAKPIVDLARVIVNPETCYMSSDSRTVYAELKDVNYWASLALKIYSDEKNPHFSLAIPFGRLESINEDIFSAGGRRLLEVSAGIRYTDDTYSKLEFYAKAWLSDNGISLISDQGRWLIKLLGRVNKAMTKSYKDKDEQAWPWDAKEKPPLVVFKD